MGACLQPQPLVRPPAGPAAPGARSSPEGGELTGRVSRCQECRSGLERTWLFLCRFILQGLSLVIPSPGWSVPRHLDVVTTGHAQSRLLAETVFRGPSGGPGAHCHPVHEPQPQGQAATLIGAVMMWAWPPCPRCPCSFWRQGEGLLLAPSSLRHPRPWRLSPPPP